MITNAFVIGLLEAAPLVLAAIGFTLIYYLNGFINVAFAENLTLGAYFAVVLNTTLGWNFYLTILPAAALTGIVSVITYLAVFRPGLRRGAGAAEMIVLSVGLSFFIRHFLRLIFGVQIYLFDFLGTSYLSIVGTGVTDVQLTALGLVVLISIALYHFIYRTDHGQRMRALANNRDLALVSGVNPTPVSVMMWFFAGAAGGLAGIFYGVFSFVDYQIGWNLLLVIIMISIIGGIGSVRGAVIAGVAAGIVTAAAVLSLPTPIYAQVLLLALFVVVLRVRGRSGTRRRLLARSGTA